MVSRIRARSHARASFLVSSKRRMALTFSLAAVMLVGLVGLLPARAASTYYVHPTNTVGGGSCASPDFNAIDAAVAAATSGLDTVFLCTATYSVASVVTITSALTIDGDGEASSIVVSSAMADAGIFGVSGAITVTFEDIALEDACQAISASGGATLNVTRVRFTDNTCGSVSPPVGGTYGAALNLDGSNASITDSVFATNSVVDAGGGALIAKGGTLDISGSRFTGNVALWSESEGDAPVGGAILLDTESGGSGTVATITDTTFESNHAGGGAVTGSGAYTVGGLGGAIYAEGADLTIEGSDSTAPSCVTDAELCGNSAINDGGALWLASTTELTLEASPAGAGAECPMFQNNGTIGDVDQTNDDIESLFRGHGGAIYSAGPITITCASFFGNGSAAANVGPSAVAAGTTFQGGAIYTTSGLDISAPAVGDTVRFDGNTVLTACAVATSCVPARGGAIVVGAPISGVLPDVAIEGRAADPDAIIFRANGVEEDSTCGGSNPTCGGVGGAIALAGGTAPANAPSISHVSFFENRATSAGAVLTEGPFHLVVEGVSRFGCPSTAGIAGCDDGDVNAGDGGNYLQTASTPVGNGGAILALGGVEVRDTSVASDGSECPTFTDNSTSIGSGPYSDWGGAVAMGGDDGSISRIQCGLFEANSARSGGAIAFLFSSAPTASIDRYIDNATFDGNLAASAGGAVALECLGDCGGAATFDIDFSTFDGNGFSVVDSATAGGAVYSTADALDVTGSTFIDNTTGGNGGAIAALTASVAGSTFEDNRSGQHGGAMDLYYGGQVVNSTFTGNGLGGAGTYGGLAIRSQGDLDLTYVTIADQYYLSADTGSVLLVDGGDLTLTNSLIDEDDTPVGVDDAGDRCVVTGAGATSGTGTITTTSTCPGTVRTSAQVDLQALADNSGPTETMALGPTSAAIDAVPCIMGLGDQRGAMRPYSDGTATDGCDAGAYEAYYTVTTSQVSLTDVPEGSTVDDDVTVEGFLDLSGLIDPAGTVQFSYCYSATLPAPTWPCTATDIGSPVPVVGAGDGTATASLVDWDPAVTADGAGPGYYLFHAEFVSDGANYFLDSEDDGTNESFTYDIATAVDTTTTTRVSQSQITYGQSVRDVATVEAQEGTDDPIGDVEFSYCWDASAWPTWGSCTPVAISTVTLSAGTVGDAKASAQTGLFTPSGVGYYLFHAEYLGDTGFNGSEDDGTNERLLVNPAPTYIDLTSGTYFTSGTSSVGLTAALSAPSGCLSGRTVTFWYDPEGDGTYQTQIGDPVTTNGSGIATASTTLSTPLPGGIFEVEERVDATTNCLDATNTATIVVAGSGDAANGGGHYVNGGRVNFGFTVQVKTNPKTSAVTVTGQMTWHKQGGYRLKGTVTSYTKLTSCPGSVTTTGATCAQISGTASYYRWDGGARRWVLVSTGIGYRIIVADGGTATVCVKKTCSTTLKPDWFRMDVPSATIAGESTEPIQLKGGGISLK